MIAAILAAGRSKRMGRNKLLLPLGDRAIVRRVVEAVLTTAPEALFVVVRPQFAESIAETLRPCPLEIIENPRADEGMGTSIARAAEQHFDSPAPLLLLQGDQPFVTANALRELTDGFFASNAGFAACRYGALVTTPVIFSAALIPELRKLDGDRGARDVLREHWSSGTIVDFPMWMGLDVDDQEGYRQACALWEERSRNAT